MDARRRKRLSKHLSLVLRHDPASVGISLETGGWVAIDTLLAALRRHGGTVTRSQLDEVVATNDKQRFAIVGDRIRANQGHSVDVDLGLAPCTPPDALFHGTARANLDSIAAHGLRRGSRHHVHLSPDTDTALRVGARHGEAVVLNVDAVAMHRDGVEFFRSHNGVWLTAAVAPRYLTRS